VCFGCSKFPVMGFAFLLEAATTEPRRGRSQTARRGVTGIRGDPERNKICRTAILSAVMGGRPIDPREAARRMYASRQFEARMAGREGARSGSGAERKIRVGKSRSPSGEEFSAFCADA